MGIKSFLGSAPSYMKTWIEKQRRKKLADPLCFTAVDPGATITLTSSGTPDAIQIVTSTDKASWNDYAVGTEIVLASPGDKVYMRAKDENDVSLHKMDGSGYYRFQTTEGKKIAASGNLQTLLKADGSRTDVPAYCYRGLFQDCKSLTQPPMLPATELASMCYYGMFWNCQSLETAPDLPAENLAASCYTAMFFNCKSLTKPPAISAKTLNMSCYSSMFSGCSSLATAPELPVEQLDMYCYDAMFQDCTSLTAAPALPASVLKSGCYSRMFSGCTALASFPELPSKTLGASCYSGMFSGCSNLAGTATISLGQMSTIPQSAFTDMFRNCSQMNVVLDFGNFTSVPSVNGGTDTVRAFEKLDSRLTVKVPTSLIDTWKTRSPWYLIASLIVEA